MGIGQSSVYLLGPILSSLCIFKHFETGFLITQAALSSIYSQGWPSGLHSPVSTHAKVGDHSHVPPCQLYVVLELGCGALSMPGKSTTN